MTDDRTNTLRDLGDRLAGLGAVQHPVGVSGSGDRLSDALLRGVPAHQALREAGVSKQLARFVEILAPRDLPGLLEAVAPVLSRSESRARELRSLAAYAWILTAATVLISAIIFGGVVPAMTEVARAGRDAHAPVHFSIALPLGFLIACTASLAGLGLVLTMRRPLFPFARSRLLQERTLVLGAAAAAAQTGSDLRVALRAAAELTAAPSLGTDALAVATSLERGAPTGGLVLFGELGSALLAAAAGQGAGVETLAALADFEEATVAGEWKGQLLKAEVLSLATGGLAICSAGALHFTIYSSAFLM